MSWYEIQGLFFGLLVSSMLKTAVIIGTLILGRNWLYIERTLGFQKKPIIVPRYGTIVAQSLH